jgi:hypothetical protein
MKGNASMLITIKTERIEFNPQKNILGLMIPKNKEQQPRHIVYPLVAIIH